MIRRLFLGVFIALVSGAWFGGHGGGGGSSAPNDPLAVLIANTINTCGHDCWVHLNATTGHGSPYQVLRDYGITTANLNSALNDPFTDGSNLLGSTCLDPQNDAGMWSYSTSGIRKPDGKLIAVATGGHCAAGISAVFSFDVMAAAANLNGGGSGGVWMMPVLPARLLKCADGAPVWQPQSGCGATGSWWYNTNPNGQQMPIDCHTYWSNQWIPGTHLAVWSGQFCTDQGGGPIPMGAGYYDDDTPHGTDSGTVHFPTLVSANTFYGYFPQPAHTRLGPSAMNERDSICPLYIWSEGSFAKWCNITTSPILTGIGGTGLDVAPSFPVAFFVPDPANPTTRQWFLTWGYADDCFGVPGSTCFGIWKDTGTPVNTNFSYSRLILANGPPTSPLDYNFMTKSAALCYDSASNVILITGGSKIIYKIADLSTGVLSTNTNNWGYSVFATGANGGTPQVSFDSGTPQACASLEPAYHAVIFAGADQGTKKMGVWLYVK